MQMKMIWVFLLVSMLVSCKTTNQSSVSKLSIWGDPDSKVQLQEKFVSIINQCTPMVLVLAPGGSTFDISKDPTKQQVVQRFVEIMLQEPKSEFDPSARLYAYYLKDRNRDLAPCSGEAAEFLLLNFALRTNLLALTRNSSLDLVILY
ncbi:MAG: hypothetical protein ACOH5I_06525 [Oligoflexus sp.]